MKKLNILIITILIFSFSITPCFAIQKYEDFILTRQETDIKNQGLNSYYYFEYLDMYDKDHNLCSVNPYEIRSGLYCSYLDSYRDIKYNKNYKYKTVFITEDASGGTKTLNILFTNSKINKSVFALTQDQLFVSKDTNYSFIRFNYRFNDDGIFTAWLNSSVVDGFYNSGDFISYINSVDYVSWSNYHLLDENGSLYHKSDVYVLSDDLQLFFDDLISYIEFKLILQILLIGLSSIFIICVCWYFSRKLFNMFKNSLFKGKINF